MYEWSWNKRVYGLVYFTGIFRANQRNIEDFWRNDGRGMIYVFADLSKV